MSSSLFYLVGVFIVCFVRPAERKTFLGLSFCFFGGGHWANPATVGGVAVAPMPSGTILPCLQRPYGLKPAL